MNKKQVSSVDNYDSNGLSCNDIKGWNYKIDDETLFKIKMQCKLQNFEMESLTNAP